MRISEAARLSGLAAKTIRFYEDEGLIEPASRSANGYRQYSNRDVHTFRFLQHARSLGFSMEDCRALLSLYQDQKRSSADVKVLAARHLMDIERKLEELEKLKSVLTELVDRCHGDDRPDCPILDDLAAVDKPALRDQAVGE